MKKAMTPVPGFEGRYSIDIDGTVFSHLLHSGEMSDCPLALKPRSTGKGYRTVWLTQNRGEGGRSHLIHRLVLLSFIGPGQGGATDVNHKNGVKHDNRLSNLEWATKSDNARHALATGLNVPVKGSLRPEAKLTEWSVMGIKALRESGFNQRQIAVLHGVHPSTISKMISGKTWRHVA